MKRPSDRVWASVALLSIIVPVGLLTTFRLTGVLKEPQRPETITVEAVSWDMSRPSRTLEHIREVVGNSYVTDTISIILNITIGRYDEYHARYYYNDVLLLRITASATLSDGLVHSINVRFSEIDAYAFLDIDENVNQFNPYNPSTYRVEDPGSYGQDAYITTRSSLNAKQCILDTLASWIFTDQNNMDHQMRVTLEVVYLDRGTYRQVDLPISLAVTAE